MDEPRQGFGHGPHRFGWIMIGFSITLTVGMLVIANRPERNDGVLRLFLRANPTWTRTPGRSPSARTTALVADRDDANLPYDREAVLAAIADLIEPDLSGYRFALMFISRTCSTGTSRSTSRQRTEDRTAEGPCPPSGNCGHHQRPGSCDEAITGLATTPTLGRPKPLIVTFANFVCSDTISSRISRSSSRRSTRFRHGPGTR
jgi:hypothetical protein